MNSDTKNMIIRRAKIADAQAICDLVNYHAELGLMLHRSLESVYESLREFHVCEQDGKITGCVALDIYWSDSAEIRSLAIHHEHLGQGIGKALVEACKTDAAEIGVSCIFAMTYEKEFFQKLGFREVELSTLPEKVSRECLAWYAEGHRHETAMLFDITREKK